MLRFVLYLTTICAVIWMCIPLIQTSGTEMAGPPGGPDPNTYTSEYLFGFPFNWMEMSFRWNESTAVKSFSFGGFQLLGLFIHLAAIFIPISILVWIDRKKIYP